MKNQGLLKILADCEYPAEFLVARLLGKKGALFRNWEALIASGNAVESLRHTPFFPYLKKYAYPGIWRFLRHEHQWVYRRMNPSLRKTFAPYFVQYEHNTLLICLRHLSSGKELEMVRQELDGSLLHEDIESNLTGGQDFASLLHRLELRFCSFSELFAGLSQNYEKKGLAGLEIFLRDTFWAVILGSRNPFLLQTFFQYLVDFDNCMSLAKVLRWQIEAEPHIISGGTIPAELLQRAYFRKDLTPVLQFLPIKDTGEAAASLQKLETVLLHFITMMLKKWSFQRTVVGDILFYLWEQYRYTRNISMVLNTAILDDDEPVRESVVA